MAKRQPGFRDEVVRYYPQVGGRAIPLGLGCAWIGQGGDAEKQRQFMATLETAYEGGFRYFDTSVLYGGSEFRVGRFLRGIERSGVFVATKCLVNETLTPEEAAIHVRQSLHNSLERLGLDTLDLFQLHELLTMEQVTAPGGILETLIALRGSGLIRYFGMATRYHDILEAAVATGEFDTILTYLDHTLLDQSAAPVIAYAAREGVGVINASPLAFGLLTGPDPRSNPDLSQEQRRYRYPAAKLYDFAASHNTPLLALALQYPQRNPRISLTLTGPQSPEECRAGLAACHADIPPETWRALQNELRVPLAETL